MYNIRIFAKVKQYRIYNYDHFDESIEENNSAFCCLTKKFGDYQEKLSEKSYNPIWFSGTSDMSIKQILNHIWDKEDIDMFVELNPECANETFTIYKHYTQEDYFSDLEFSRGNYRKYCPLQEKRDKLLKELL